MILSLVYLFGTNIGTFNVITGFDTAALDNAEVTPCGLTDQFTNDCLVTASETCHKANLTTNITSEVFGFFNLTTIKLHKILGLESGKCVFYSGILDLYGHYTPEAKEFLIKAAAQKGISENVFTQTINDVENSFNTRLATLKQENITCKFDTDNDPKDLTVMLNKWKAGNIDLGEISCTTNTDNKLVCTIQDDNDDGNYDYANAECEVDSTGTKIKDILTSQPPIIIINNVNNKTYQAGLQTKRKIYVNISINEQGNCRINTNDTGYDNMSIDCETKPDNTKLCSLDLKTTGTRNLYLTCNDNYGNNHTSAAKTLSLDVEPVHNMVITKFDSQTSGAFKTDKLVHNLNLQISSTSPCSVCRISNENKKYSDITNPTNCKFDGFITACNSMGSTLKAGRRFKCQYTEPNEIQNKENPNGDYALFLVCKSVQDSLETIKVINYTIYIPVPDYTDPRITSVNPKDLKNDTTKLTWNTDEDSNSTLFYGKNQSMFDKTIKTSTYKKAHSIELTNLKPKTEYFYNITVCDKSNNCNYNNGTFKFTTKKTPKDTDSPVIYNHSFLKETNTSVLISWTTDENSICNLIYGINKTNMSLTVQKTTFAKSYKINLSNLNKNKFYYKMNCSDFWNNSIVSKRYDFTLSPPGSCSFEFVCGDWSECVDEVQIKTCKDKKKCKKDTKQTRPCEEQGGDSTLGGTANATTDQSTTTTTGDDQDIDVDKDKSYMGLVILLIIFIIIILGFGATYFIYEQGKLPQLDPIMEKIGLLKLPKPPKPSKPIKIDPLKAYILEMRKQGYSKDQIYHNLINHGYRPDQINKYF